MKKIVSAALIFLYLVSCEKDNAQPDKEEEPLEIAYLNYIVAGNNEGPGIKYSGVINDTLFFDYPNSDLNILIDLNGDGINNVEYRFFGSASPGHNRTNNSIKTIGNSYLATPQQADSLVSTIPLNDTINANLNWVNGTCLLYEHYEDDTGFSYSAGLWRRAKDKYIGTKIIVDEKVYYGWIRVDLGNGWNPVLIDYSCTVEYELE